MAALSRRGAQGMEGGDELALVRTGRLIASFTRRTLTLTTAPIFSSFRRIVWAQAAKKFPPVRYGAAHA